MEELISLGILKVGFWCKSLVAITLIQLILSFCFTFETGLLIGQTDPKLPMWLRMTLNRLFTSPLQSWNFHFKFNFKFKFNHFKLSTSCFIHNYSVCILAHFQSALESYFFEYEEQRSKTILNIIKAKQKCAWQI